MVQAVNAMMQMMRHFVLAHASQAITPAQVAEVGKRHEVALGALSLHSEMRSFQLSRYIVSKTVVSVLSDGS